MKKSVIYKQECDNISIFRGFYLDPKYSLQDKHLMGKKVHFQKNCFILFIFYRIYLYKNKKVLHIQKFYDFISHSTKEGM